MYVIVTGVQETFLTKFNLPYLCFNVNKIYFSFITLFIKFSITHLESSSSVNHLELDDETL